MNNRKVPLCLQNSSYSLNEKWFIQPVFSVLTLLVQRQSFSKHFFTSFYLKVVVILSTPVFRGTYFSRFHKKIAHWKSVNKDFPQISRKWNFVPWLLIIYMSFFKSANYLMSLMSIWTHPCPGSFRHQWGNLTHSFSGKSMYCPMFP